MNSALIFGSLDYELLPEKPNEPHYYNSAFFYSPGTNGQYLKYDKIQLLPFAERLPFEGLFPIISRVDLGEADFTPGDSLHRFALKKHQLFIPICYEVVYPWFIRDFVNAGGDLMVQITNDGWFGYSAMPYEHANIARFRAVETGVPVARCANTGVSCFIDPFGRILQPTRIFTTTINLMTLPLNATPTPYLKIGDLWGVLSLILVGMGLLTVVARSCMKRK